MMHVNSQLKHKALVMIFNPLSHAVERQLRLPLYYTGLTETARIREKEGKPVTYRLDRHYTVTVLLKMEPGGVT